jgi:hypothetical protein
MSAKASRHGERWTTREDRLIERHHPDYNRLERLLRRGRGAIISRMKHLRAEKGLTRTPQRWIASEHARFMRRCRGGATLSELAREFPNRTPEQLRREIYNWGFRRPPPPSALIVEPALVEIRRMAKHKGLSYRDLDRMSGAKHYFSRSVPRAVLRHLVKAATAMGGRVVIDWSDDDAQAEGPLA